MAKLDEAFSTLRGYGQQAVGAARNLGAGIMGSGEPPAPTPVAPPAAPVADPRYRLRINGASPAPVSFEMNPEFAARELGKPLPAAPTNTSLVSRMRPGVGTGAGGVLAAAGEALDPNVRAAVNPDSGVSMTDRLKTGARTALRVGGGILGGAAGGTLGSVVPFGGTAIGGLAGGAAGYSLGDRIADALVGPQPTAPTAPPAPNLTAGIDAEGSEAPTLRGSIGPSSAVTRAAPAPAAAPQRDSLRSYDGPVTPGMATTPGTGYIKSSEGGGSYIDARNERAAQLSGTPMADSYHGGASRSVIGNGEGLRTGAGGSGGSALGDLGGAAAGTAVAVGAENREAKAKQLAAARELGYAHVGATLRGQDLTADAASARLKYDREKFNAEQAAKLPAEQRAEAEAAAKLNQQAFEGASRSFLGEAGGDKSKADQLASQYTTQVTQSMRSRVQNLMKQPASPERDAQLEQVAKKVAGGKWVAKDYGDLPPVAQQQYRNAFDTYRQNLQLRDSSAPSAVTQALPAIGALALPLLTKKFPGAAAFRGLRGALAGGAAGSVPLGVNKLTSSAEGPVSTDLHDHMGAQVTKDGNSLRYPNNLRVDADPRSWMAQLTGTPADPAALRRRINP